MTTSELLQHPELQPSIEDLRKQAKEFVQAGRVLELTFVALWDAIEQAVGDQELAAMDTIVRKRKEGGL